LTTNGSDDENPEYCIPKCRKGDCRRMGRILVRMEELKQYSDNKHAFCWTERYNDHDEIIKKKNERLEPELHKLTQAKAENMEEKYKADFEDRCYAARLESLGLVRMSPGWFEVVQNQGKQYYPQLPEDKIADWDQRTKDLYTQFKQHIDRYFPESVSEPLRDTWIVDLRIERG
jgi:hypothetical protein